MSKASILIELLSKLGINESSKIRTGDLIPITIDLSKYPKTKASLGWTKPDQVITIDIGEMDPDELALWAADPDNIKKLKDAAKRTSSSSTEREAQYWANRAFNPSSISSQYATKVVQKEVENSVDSWEDIDDASKDFLLKSKNSLSAKINNPEDRAIYTNFIRNLYMTIDSKFKKPEYLDLISYWIMRTGDGMMLLNLGDSSIDSKIKKSLDRTDKAWDLAMKKGIRPESSYQAFTSVYLGVGRKVYAKIFQYLKSELEGWK